MTPKSEGILEKKKKFYQLSNVIKNKKMFLRNKVISPQLLCATNGTRMFCLQTICLAGNMPTFSLPIVHYAFWALRLDTVYRALCQWRICLPDNVPIPKNNLTIGRYGYRALSLRIVYLPDIIPNGYYA